MPQPIEELFRLPAPERVVLLGKGPSLKRWNPADAEAHIVWGINETCESHPCDYAIFLDRHFVIGDAPLRMPAHTTPIRHEQYGHYFNGRGYTFNKQTNVPPNLCHATAPFALALLGKWGVRNILMVGFDAWDDKRRVYADHLSIRRPCGGGDYSVINSQIADALDKYNINAEWWHREAPCAT